MENGIVQPPAQEERRLDRRSLADLLRNPTDLLSIVLYTLFFALIIKTFFLEAYRIPSSSMEETLQIGDFVFVNKFIYGIPTPRSIPFTEIELPHWTIPGIKSPRRGDIVVFGFPGSPDDEEYQRGAIYVKRCIGIPGDTIRIVGGVLSVNGRQFPDPKTARSFRSPTFSPDEPFQVMYPKGTRFNPDYYGPIVVPARGMTISLTRSTIEQWLSFIEREGHHVTIDPDGVVQIDDRQCSSYTVERNYFFMLGDNRSNSYDSRYWGFLPEENVIGQAILIYWSWDTSIPISDFLEKIKAIRWDRIGIRIQ